MKKNINILFFGFLILFFFFYFGGFKFFRNISESPGDDKYLFLFSEVMNLVKTDYVEELNPLLKYPGAFSSLVSGVDDYSSYLDERKSRTFRLYQQGNYYGIGVYGIKKNNYFYITDIIPDSPALKAGLKIGDIIRYVNGNSLYALSYWDMFLSMISEKSIPFTLICLKKNSENLQTLTINPIFISRTVKFRKLSRDIQLISLMRLDTMSVAQIKARMTEYKNSKWIIDLRRYSGGDFKSFLEVSNIFVHENVFLSIETKNGKINLLVGSDNGPGYDCVFIINASTILYSELLAHILKLTNAILIGEETSGFVPRLKQFYLDDGTSVVLNTGIYKLMNNPILGTGVKPMYERKTIEDNALFSACISILGDHK